MLEETIDKSSWGAPEFLSALIIIILSLALLYKLNSGAKKDNTTIGGETSYDQPISIDTHRGTDIANASVITRNHEIPQGAQSIRKLEKKQARNAEKENLARVRAEKEKRLEEREKKVQSIQQKKDSEREAKQKEENRTWELKKQEEYKIYEQWKETLDIIEEGQSSMNLSTTFENFASYISTSKFISLSSLVAEFELKTKDVIDRIQELEKMGYISGVFDDRGRYISITKDEFNKLAEFINTKGKILKHTDLIPACNRIIHLDSTLSHA